MTKNEFAVFLSELKELKDAEKLKCTLSNEFSNVVLLSGEIFGEDTLDKIRGIGKVHGVEVLTDGLSVMYRNPKPAFRVD
ncbi:MAG: hypothetical protein GY823_00280 [Flavobacteriaceae bacterium]|nr:hypothetical protein [Flavobacteriaceae bacterium]MCP4991192.1 hypothetical protein [Colwellia sp.]